MGYCVMCGSEIPDDQRTCSMCYGDPSHGHDGYYQQYLYEQENPPTSDYPEIDALYRKEIDEAITELNDIEREVSLGIEELTQHIDELESRNGNV